MNYTFILWRISLPDMAEPVGEGGLYRTGRVCEMRIDLRRNFEREDRGWDRRVEDKGEKEEEAIQRGEGRGERRVCKIGWWWRLWGWHDHSFSLFQISIQCPPLSAQTQSLWRVPATAVVILSSLKIYHLYHVPSIV